MFDPKNWYALLRIILKDIKWLLDALVDANSPLRRSLRCWAVYLPTRSTFSPTNKAHDPSTTALFACLAVCSAFFVLASLCAGFSLIIQAGAVNLPFKRVVVLIIFSTLIGFGFGGSAKMGLLLELECARAWRGFSIAQKINTTLVFAGLMGFATIAMAMH